MSGAAEFVGLISVFQTCVHGYRALCSFVTALKHMGHDVADLESRLHEAETRTYAFGRIHNMVVEGSGDRVGNMPPYWLKTVNAHMAQIKKHLEDAEAIAAKYPEPPLSSGAAAAVLASDDGAKQKQKAVVATAAAEHPRHSSSSADAPDPATFRLQRRPTDSLSVAVAQAELRTRRAGAQSARLSQKLAWSLHDRKALVRSIEGLERENDALFYLTVPELATLLYGAVAGRLSREELRNRASRARGEA